MKYILYLFFFIFFGFFANAQEFSQNNLSIPSIFGSQPKIDLSGFKGSKVLVLTYSLAELDEINYLRFIMSKKLTGKLIVLICPIFEPGDSGLNLELLKRAYSGLNLPDIYITHPLPEKGKEQHPLFKWISQKSGNGIPNEKMLSRFNKFIINEEGIITGYFSAQVKLGNPIIKRAFSE